MKRLFASLTLALALTAAATAQASIGVKGIGALGLGTTLPKEQTEYLDNMVETAKALGIDASWNLSPVFTGGFGLYGRYNIPALPALGFQAEFDMLFNNGESTVIKSVADSSTYKSEFTYNTIEIPVLVTYDIKAGPVTIGLNAGPDFVIPYGKIHAKETRDGPGYSDSSKIDEDIASKFIVGAIGGADVNFNAGPVTLGFGLQYEADFMPMKSINGNDELEMITRRGLRASISCAMKF